MICLKRKYYISFYKSTIKENGYNVKPAGFYVTGTHGKTLSQREKNFLNEKNRIQSSIDHGGESFLYTVYWNKNLLAMD